MKIQFTFSREKEIDKLINISSEYQWFIDNVFPISVPGFYDKLYKEAETKSIFKRGLIDSFKKVYKRDVYIDKEKAVKENWNKVSSQVFNILKELELVRRDHYSCHISLYGPQGQYEYPDIIDIRIVNENDIKEANETIAHELLHLLIFNKAKKLRLDYQTTEGLVDLFFTETRLKDIFPYYKIKSISNTDKALFSKLVYKK
jgi:uncharacterized protein YjaZ